MSPQTRVSVQEIVNALLRWRGCVKATADDLGISRKNLYERIERERLDLAGFRTSAGGVTPIRGDTGDMSPRTDSGSTEKRGARNACAPLSSARGLRKVAPMSTPVTEIEARRKERPLRVAPDQEEIVRRGRRQLAAKLNQDLSDDALLAQFILERFDGWIDEVRERLTVKEDSGTKAKRPK